MMHDDTIRTVERILKSDPNATEDQVTKVIQACRSVAFRRRRGSIRDAAGILDVHPGSIKRYVKKGLLHPIRITARKVRYDLDEVERLACYGAGAVTEGKGDQQ